jgi:hypothetical protein
MKISNLVVYIIDNKISQFYYFYKKRNWIARSPLRGNCGGGNILKKEYHLKPFNSKGRADKFTLSAILSRMSDFLAVSYQLKGPVKDLSFQPPSGKPERRNKLWDDTCFELFLMPSGSETYWEFNLAPSGDWNAYSFNGYRQGMGEERAIGTLPFDVTILPDCLRLEVEIDLGKIIKSQSTINTGISAVIRNGDHKTFWALVHYGTSPDFHRRDGFIIEL